MFALERIKLIKKYLNENTKAEVAVLSSLLDVSEVTIRRDLEKLEREGFLKRIHGGAILSDEMEEALSVPSSEDPLLASRMEIADIASQMVEDNDVIMLTQGLANLQLARHLKDKKNLTVLTNDLLIALELSALSSVRVIILGGDLENQSKGVFGNFTINSIRSFYVNKTFFEVEGVKRQAGFTVSTIEKANLIQEAVKIAEEAVCLCTGNCFGNTAFYPVGDVSLAGKIVTNASVRDEYKNYIFERNIQLFTSVQMYEGHV
jgi:DeoR family transcriptional regulator, fructose operon transcriptional repressor